MKRFATGALLVVTSAVTVLTATPASAQTPHGKYASDEDCHSEGLHLQCPGYPRHYECDHHELAPRGERWWLYLI